MKNIEIGATLRKLRHSKMWRVADVEQALQGAIAYDAICRMETGSNKTISIPKLQLLADVFGVTVTEIFRDAEGIKDLDIGLSQLRKVPVISWVQAGNWTDSPASIDDIDNCDTVISPPNAGPNAYALRVSGDSMSAPSGMSFPDSSLIVVNPDKEPANLDFVIAYFEDTGESTFKQLLIDGPNKILKPLNPIFPPIQTNGNITISGVVCHMQWSNF